MLLSCLKQLIVLGYTYSKDNSKCHVILLRWICGTAAVRERERKSYFVSLQMLYHWKETDTTSIYCLRKTQDNHKMIRSRKFNNSNPGHENVIVWLMESCQSCLYQKIPLKSLFRSSVFFMNAATLQTYRHILKTEQECSNKGDNLCLEARLPLCSSFFQC